MKILKTPLMVVVVSLFLAPLFYFSVAHAATAAPSDYDIETPTPSPSLPVGVDTFTPPLLDTSTGPNTAEYTRTASPDDTAVLAGPTFTSSTSFRFFGQTNSSDTISFYRSPNSVDSNAASVVLPSGLPAWSTYIVWPKNGSDYGAPSFINRTDAWWMTDEGVAGDTVAVYGRNLSHNNGTSTSYIYIKPVGNAVGQWVTPSSVNPYKVEFTVPNLSAGTYEVWAHNGHGGEFGWSGPLSFTILSQDRYAGQSGNVFNVKNYGAAGDGVADDRAAIQSALVAAYSSGMPATIYFPAGTYAVSSAIFMLHGVSFVGDSKDTSIIEAGPTFADDSDSALIQAQEYDDFGTVEFKNITIDGNDNLGNFYLFKFQHQHYLKLTNARLNWKGFPDKLSLASTDHIVIKNSEFIGNGLFLGNATQVRVTGSNFRLTDDAESAITSWGGEEIEVSNNTAQDYNPSATTTAESGSGRFFTSQAHPDSNRNLYIGDNTTTNMSPITNVGDANRGEVILFEEGTSKFFGTPTAASATSVTFGSSLPTEGGEFPGQTIHTRDAVIVKGKGVGQRRKVTAVNGNSITVSPAWLVVPDATSVVGVGPGQFNAAVYHNSFDGKSNYASYETASTGMQLYGNGADVIYSTNTLTDIRGGITIETSQKPTVDASVPSVAFFTTVSNNTLNGAYIGMSIVTNEQHEDQTGTIGHLGNVYRANTLSNISAHGIALLSDSGAKTGGDVDHNVFEHNTVTNVPNAVWQHRGYQFSNAAVVTNFSNINLYKNTFTRGSAALSGSKAFDLLGSTTTFWRTQNTYNNFETGSVDPDTLPLATLIDEVGPIISSVTSGSIGTLIATITWNTDEAASSQVEYGTTTSYGSTSTIDLTLGTSHLVLLSGLTPNTTYHYRVISEDGEGNSTTSPDYTFTTSRLLGGGGGGGGGSSSSSSGHSSVTTTPSVPTNTIPRGCTSLTVFSPLTGEKCPTVGTGINPAPGQTIAVPTIVVSATILNVRQSINGPILGKVLKGTEGTLVAGAVSDPWIKVAFPGGLTGYVFTGYIQIKSAQTTPITPPSSSPTLFSADLKLGSKGEAVRALQSYLNSHGFPVALSGPGSLGQETFTFGPATKAALIRFQIAKSVTPSAGYFGPKTRAVINQ